MDIENLSRQIFTEKNIVKVANTHKTMRLITYFVWRKDCCKVLWTKCRGGTVTQKIVPFGTLPSVWDAHISRMSLVLSQPVI